MSGSGRGRSLTATLSVAATVAVFGAGLVIVPATTTAAGAAGEASEAAALPALRSEPAPVVTPVASDASFAGAPPIDGDVARGNEELAAAREAAKPKERFDPASAELVGRDAISDTYLNADGTQTRLVHQGPVNYLDPVSGEWVPFDVTLAPDADGRLAAKSSPYGVSFGETADAAQVLRVGRDGWSVSFGVEGAAKSPAKAESVVAAQAARDVPGVARGDTPGEYEAVPPAGATNPKGDPPKETAKALWSEPLGEQATVASYGEIAPGVELRYYSSPEAVKEEIRLTRAPAGPLRFRFPLSLTGVTARVDADGSIGFYDATGERVAGVPAAFMLDAATAAAPDGAVGPVPVTLALEESPEGPVVVLTPDAAWLADPARVYPVSIDPVIKLGTETAQADVEVENCTGNAYDGAGQHIGYGIYANHSGYYYPGCDWRSLAYYNLGAAAGTFIQSAQWSPAWLSTYSWGYGIFTAVNGNAGAWCACYMSWALQPGVYSDQQLVLYPGANTRGAYDITSWVKYWADTPTQDHNYGLSTGSNGWMTGVDWGANETAGTTWDSWIDVTYDHPPGASTPSSPADATVFTTTTPTGFAGSSATDPDGQTVKYWLRISTNPGGDTGQVYNSGWVTTPDSSTSGFFGDDGAVPPGTLQDGVTYYWKIYTGDFANPSDPLPITQTGSLARSFKVNLRLGTQGTNPTDSLGPAAVNLSNGNLSVTTGSPSFATVGGPIGLTFSYNSQQPTTQGLTGRYYDEGATPDWVINGEPFLVRTDPRVDFSWGSGSPVPNGPVDNVLVRWKGYVKVPSGGDWQFGARSDDGVRIWVNQASPQLPPSFNGQLNDWTEHPQPATPQWGSPVTLTGGVAVPIQVDYYERGVLSALTLYAKKTDGSEEQIVDASWLSTEPQVLPTGWRASADLDGALGYTGANISTNQVVITDTSGQPHTYTSTGAGFTPPTGEFSTLVRNSDNTFTLHDDTGMDYRFSKDGQLLDATAAGVDDRTPAAPKYNYTSTGSPRLESIEDRVSGKKLLLKYSGDSACTAPPAGEGFDATAPSGMLCQLDYTAWSSDKTNLWYVNGQLARIVDPGDEVTDFAYANGRLTKIRDPLAADAVKPSSTPQRANDDTTRTIVHYDAAGRVDSVKLAEPLAGAARPEHQYRYVSATETQVDVVGLSPASGYARRVVFDGAGRVTDAYDATTKHATATWDARDLPLTATDPAGIVTSTGYDAQGRATSSSVANGGTTATSTTTYDAGMPGLLATWWDNKNLTGIPKVHTLGIGGPGGTVDRSWGSGAPGPATIPADNFGLRLTGEINLPTSGDYKFRVSSDNGVRLYVDDKLVVDQWVDAVGNPWPDSLPVPNVAPNGTTWHRIRLDYFESVGGANLTLGWIPPGGSAATVPGSSLTPRLDLVTLSQDPDGKTTATGYADPALGLATSTTVDPGGLALTTSTSYEALGTGFLRRTSRTLPAGNFWTYTYYANTASVAPPAACGGPAANQAGFLKTRTGPDPDGAGTQSARVEETIYDNAGRPIASKVKSEDWACVTYDSRGRVTTRAIPAFGGEPARTVTNTYTVNGNPLESKVSDPAGDITATVDLLGRVVAYTDVWDKTTTTSYDQAGRAVSSAGPLGAQAVTYDAAGRVEQVTLDGAVLADPAYDTAGRFDSVAYPSGPGNAGNGTSLAPVTREPLGRVTGLTWRDPTAATITADSVTRSLAGRVTDQAIDGVDADPANPNFTYDAAGRLDVARVPGHVLDDDFDTGNRSILFVVSDPAAPVAGDVAVRDRLVAQGWTVTYADDNGITAGAATGKRLVIISSSVASSNVNTTFRNTAVPVVTWEASIYDDMKMTNTTAGTHYGVATASTLTIADPTSPLAAGLTGTPTTNTAAATYSWGTPSAGATVAATIPGQATQAAVFGYEAGATMVGQNAPARRVGLHLNDATPTTLTADGWRLVDAAVVWAAGTSGWNSNRTQHSDTPTGGSPVATTYSYDQADKLVATSTAGMATIAYDAHGNTTTLGNQTFTYDGADRHVESSASGTTVRYVRDATDRIVERKVDGVTVAKYSYTGGGDTPDLTLDASNAIIEKNYGLPGGATLTKRSGGDVWSYPNVHGDVAATANSAGAKQGTTYTYDPYGNPLSGLPDNLQGGYDNGWLGQHQRSLEHQAGLFPIIEMGERQYSPLLGRFLEADPIEAGSCSDYDYVCADPTNGKDLAGTGRRVRGGGTRSKPKKQAEQKLCESGIRWGLACAAIGKNRESVKRELRKYYKPGEAKKDGTRADAFEHVYFMALNASRAVVGEHRAREFGQALESEQSPRSPAVKMDLNNNESGILIGKIWAKFDPDFSDEELAAAVFGYVRDGSFGIVTYTNCGSTC